VNIRKHRKHNRVNIKNINSGRGYTFLEIFISVALLSVILAAAFPSLSEFAERRKVIASAQEIAGLLSTARQQAIIENDEFRTCWNETNQNDTGTRNLLGQQVLHGGFVHARLSDQTNLILRSDISGDRTLLRENLPGRCIFWSDDGRSLRSNGNPKTGSFFVCRSNGEDDGSVEIIIDNSGRARINRNVAAGSC